MLCKCAEIFEKCFRKEDIIARWGGDEFLILLPKTTEQEVLNIINRIEQECLKLGGGKTPLSIAMGSSTKTVLDKNIKEVIFEAEEWMYQKKLIESKSFSSSAIDSLKRILIEKSIETEEHTNRTNIIALQLGKNLNLTENELAELSLLSTLHDIGKIAIPEKIILKKGSLSEIEWKIIKTHPKIGYNIIKAAPHLAHVAEDILAHHEWWDGSGYPRGLKGDEIPLVSRIFAFADAYDVMINGRPYKNKMDIENIVEEFKKYSGKQFDPFIVKNFLHIMQKNNIDKSK